MFSINIYWFIIQTSAAENYVVHPVCVMLHGLEVRVLRILHIPYPERLCKCMVLYSFMTCDHQPLSPDDAVSPRAVQPLEVVIVLEAVYPGPVAALTLVPDHKTHLEFKKIVTNWSCNSFSSFTWTLRLPAIFLGWENINLAPFQRMFICSSLWKLQFTVNITVT